MSYTVDSNGKRIPRKRVGTYSFVCPDCHREHEGTLWMDNPKNLEDDMGFVRGEKHCPCGKYWLVSETEFDGPMQLFDLTKDSSPHVIEELKPEQRVGPLDKYRPF